MVARPRLFDPSHPLPLQGLSPSRQTGVELEERSSAAGSARFRGLPFVPVPPLEQLISDGELITSRRRSRTGNKWNEHDRVDEDGVCTPGPIRRMVKPRRSKHFDRSRTLMQGAGVTLLPVAQVTGRAYQDLCRHQIPSIWGHPSNFQHIASAEALAAADMLSDLANSNIVATTRLMGAIPLTGLSASALDPLAVTEACLNELSVAFRDAYPWVGGFSEIVIKEVAGDEHDGKTGTFIRDAISGTKHTFAEWREIADRARREEGAPFLKPELYVVPHFHLVIAVMGQDGRWWTEREIRQRLTDTVCRERQASFPKKLGGRRRGGHTSTQGHVMSCIEYAIKPLNEMNDDELLLVNLWRAMSANSGFINVVLTSTQTLPHQLVEFLDKRQAALARTLIEKNHFARAGSVEEIMAFLTSRPRLVSVNNTPSKSGTKPAGTRKMPVIQFIVGQVRWVFETVGNWLGKYWPPWSG